MDLAQRIDCLVDLGEYLMQKDERLQAHIHRTYYRNNWFTKENQWAAIEGACEGFLKPEKLQSWLSEYDLQEGLPPKRIGLVPTANVPLAWFHDMLCIFLSGNISVAKLSEKDEFMMPFLVKKMQEINIGVLAYFEFPEQLPIKELDGVIAMGGNNSNRYLEQYFAKHPNIIRRNRYSLAVLHGDETPEDFRLLGNDIFQYFGLGPRNVSKILVPKGYDFNSLLEVLHERKELAMHTKYKNNFDYQFTLLILNKVKHYNNGCLLLREEKSLASPISVLHYTEYESLDEIMDFINDKKQEIQCLVSSKGIPDVSLYPMGKAHAPSLSDYVGNVDTMKFLLGIGGKG